MTRGVYDRSLTQRERTADQRRRLLLSATYVFSRKGYAGASVEAIISRAEMSRRTFYEHFKDLADILLHVHDGSARIAQKVVTAAMTEVSDPMKRIEVGIATFLDLIANNGDLARVLFREVRAAGPQYELRRDRVLVAFGDLLSEAVSDAHKAGLLKRGPDALSIYALTASIEALGMRSVERKDQERLKEAVPTLLRMVRGTFS